MNWPIMRSGRGFLEAAPNADMRSGMDATDISDTDLTRDGGQSLHHQISAVLRAAILAGRYAENAYVPAESVLMDTFNVSRATVRRALLTLEHERLIDRQQGKGTRVIYRQPEARSLIEQHINRIEYNAARTSVRVLSFDQELPPLAVRAALQLDRDVPVLKVVRLRMHDELPLRYLVNHIPEDIGRKMRPEQFERQTVIAALKAVGFPARRFDDEIGATLADPRLARALDVRIGAPLVEVTRTMFDKDRRPIAHQWSFVPPDRGKLRSSMKSEDS